MGLFTEHSGTEHGTKSRNEQKSENETAGGEGTDRMYMFRGSDYRIRVCGRRTRYLPVFRDCRTFVFKNSLQTRYKHVHNMLSHP